MSIRSDIPEALKRQVLIEAGHRCAIPTCKHPTTEIAHIKPWVKVKKHTFDNLIALCPNCHTRYDKGDIDRKAMLIYKYNLTLLNHRYGRFELIILQKFIDSPQMKSILLPGWHDLHVYYLLKDGLLIKSGKFSATVVGGVPPWEEYLITLVGRQFIENYRIGLPLD